MHSGGSHTTHITGSNAVDTEAQPFPKAHDGNLVPQAGASTLTPDSSQSSGLGNAILQSFQNTRHGQADPDRFSGSVDHSVHNSTLTEEAAHDHA